MMLQLDVPSFTNSGALLMLAILAWPAVKGWMERKAREAKELKGEDDEQAE